MMLKNRTNKKNLEPEKKRMENGEASKNMTITKRVEFRICQCRISVKVSPNDRCGRIRRQLKGRSASEQKLCQVSM